MATTTVAGAGYALGDLLAAGIEPIELKHHECELDGERAVVFLGLGMNGMAATVGLRCGRNHPGAYDDDCDCGLDVIDVEPERVGFTDGAYFADWIAEVAANREHEAQMAGEVA